LSEAIKIELPELNLTSESREKWRILYLEKLNSITAKWQLDIWNFLLNWINESTAIQLKTSGSTGEPKIIEVRKSTLIFSAEQTIQYFQFKENEKWLLCLPAAFVGGQMILVRAILSKSQVWAVEPKIDLAEMTVDFDFASMIPMQVEKYIQNNVQLKISKILIGGASISTSLENKLKYIKNISFYASYGMTETVSHIALRKVNGEDSSIYFSGLKNILLGKDDRGCLTIYNRNYSENVLITNDLVEFDTYERFKIIGRIDNIINSGGLKIIPEEIELRISEIVTQRIMIIGIPDEVTGEKPILLMEGEELDKGTLLLLKNYLLENIDKKKIPKEIVFMNRLEETANGKLDRKKSKEVYLKNLRTNL